MPCFDNLRDYLAALDELGDVMHIHREVDGDLEPGAITRRRLSCLSLPLTGNA